MIWLTLLLQISSPSFAQKPAPKPQPTVRGQFKPVSTEQVKASMNNLGIAKGTTVEIRSYDGASDTFELSISKEPAVGPNVTTSQNLFKALGIEKDFKEFMRRKKDMMGSEFTLKERLPLLQPSDIEKRKKDLPH
jgi:hypothetical protein